MTQQGEKPKLLMIEPSRLDVSGNAVRIKREGMRTLTLPYLAGMTPHDWEVQIINDALFPVSGNEAADLVAVTVLTQRAMRAYQLADKFRGRGVPVVLGGAHVTLNPDEAAAHADAIVVGEAENVWDALLEDFKAGKPQKLYRCDERHSMEKLARPRLDLVANNKYYTLLRPAQTTRGCPHHCDFCTVPQIYGRSYRRRPVGEVIEDVKAIRKTSRYVFFVDDNLTANADYAARLFEALIPLDISWSAQLTLAFAENKELLRLAARSGFQMAVVGIENVCEENLAAVGKDRLNKPERYRELITRYRKAGVLVLAGMILGFDEDTEETIARNVDFMLTEKIPMISLFIMTPFPGTPLFKRLDGEGRLLTKDWSHYDSYTCVYRPKNLTPERLTELYWDACRKITTIPAVLRRFSPPPLPRMRSFFPDLAAISLVFANNLVLFRRDARKGVAPQV